MPLTAKQIEDFLSGREAIGDLIDKIPDDQKDEANPEVEASLDKAARSNGFKDYAEFELVASNVEFLLAGFDSKKREFVGHEAVLEQEISEIEADSEMRPRTKEKHLKELREMLSDAPTVAFPSNIALVTKYFDKLSEAFDDDE